MKKEIKILGIDDCPFERNSTGRILVFGVIFRGASYLEGVLQTSVDIDGTDSTDQIAEMILQSSHHQQLKLIMTDGITVGGFNVIDIAKLSARVDLPVIVIIDRHPDFDSIQNALQHLPDGQERWKLISKLREVQELELTSEFKSIYFQPVNVSVEDARAAILSSIKTGRIPEPIRVAHLIARSFKQK